jgi:N,N-dimethylformamidase beta subunit-like, C-terminal
MRGGLTRRRLLGAGVSLAVTASGAAAGLARAVETLAGTVTALAVRNTGRRYAGDRELFATVAPGVPGRGTARVSLTLPRQAIVTLEAVRTGTSQTTVVWSMRRALGAGSHGLLWTPEPTTPVGSYVMRLTIDRNGKRTVIGSRRPKTPARAVAPVTRVLGVEMSFRDRSYVAGDPMPLRVFADAARFTLTFLRVGYGPDPSLRPDEMTGEPMGDPVPIDWSGKRFAPRTITVQTGLDWPSSLYVARLETDDGRVGFAPFVIRPSELGASGRVAVVMPSNTWQAYNLYDADGDGWGDTWYAGGTPPVVLDRPFRDRGVPPRFGRYDFPFLRWLEKRRHEPDVLSEDDLEALDGDALRDAYDLVVFPGHTEYVTEHEYDVVERFRDLGGRLMFLSANNFFWKVEREGSQIRRIRLWRDLGRPEAQLLGVQYRGNDDGTRQGVYEIVGAERVPWLFEGTELENGSTLGDDVGGYGIEIDGITPDSPPGTALIALVPNLLGPGLDGQMAYYETEAGARVFSAGTLDFCTSVLTSPVNRMLDNLWQQMTEDAEPPPAE